MAEYYGVLGEVDTALGDYYAEQVRTAAAATSVDERRIRTWFERSLIVGQGIRGQVLRGAEQSEGLDNRVIQLLVDDHLVRAEERHGITWYELAHDRLIGPIQADNARFDEDLNLFQRRAARWAREHRPSSLLLQGNELADAERWAAQHADILTPGEREYLARAREARAHAQRERDRRSARQFRILGAGATIVAVLAVMLAVLAMLEGRRADAGAVIAQQNAEMAQVNESRANQLAVEARQNAAEAQTQMRIAQEQQALAGRETLLAQSLDSRIVASRLDLALLLGLEATRGATGHALTRGLMPPTVAAPNLLGMMPGHQSSVRSLAFSPDGKILASSSADRMILLRSALQGNSGGMPISAPLTDHTDTVYSVSFSPDGKILASASRDGTIRLWDLLSDQPVGRILGRHDGGVFSVSFNRDGSRLVSGGGDKLLRLWDVASGRQIAESRAAHTSAIYRVAFRPGEGALVASGGDDGRLILWNTDTLELVRTLNEASGSGVFGMAFSPDGAYLATGGSDGAIMVWDVAGGSQAGQSYYVHQGSVFDVTFSPDGKLFASAGADKRVLLWSRTGADLSLSKTDLRGWQEKFVSLVFSPDGRELGAGGASGTITRWDILGDGIGEPLRGIHDDDIESVAYSPTPTEDDLLASLTPDQVWLTNTITRVRGAPLPMPPGVGFWSLAFSPNGALLAAGGMKKDRTQGYVALWDVATRKPTDPAGFDVPLGISTLAFSPDGTLLALGGCKQSEGIRCRSGDVRLWDLANRRLIDPPRPGREEMGFHESQVYSVAFSPDGTLLASADENGWILLWDVATRVPIGRLPDGHSRSVLALAFSPDGAQLASGSHDSNVILWNVKERKSIGSTFALHTAGVTSLAFSPDGSVLVSGSLDGTVILWDANSRLPLGQLPRQNGLKIHSLSLNRRGDQLVAGGSGGEQLIHWDIGGDHWRAQACHLVGRHLTEEEWQLYVGSGPPRPICPNVLVQQAVLSALRGDRATAEVAFSDARRIASDMHDAEMDNYICWQGSLEGFPALVLESCDRAVRTLRGTYRGAAQDSRGVALVLLGRHAEAIAAFEAYLTWVKEAKPWNISEESVDMRRQWIAKLQQGQDPFDKETLRALRLE